MHDVVIDRCEYFPVLEQLVIHLRMAGCISLFSIALVADFIEVLSNAPFRIPFSFFYWLCYTLQLRLYTLVSLLAALKTVLAFSSWDSPLCNKGNEVVFSLSG